MASPAELEDTNDQIGSLQTQAGELDSSYQQALSRLVAVDSEVNLQNGEMRAAGQRRDEVQFEIQAEQKVLEDLQDQLTARQSALETRLRSSYKSDDVGYLEVLLGADTFENFMVRVDWISRIADEDRALIESIMGDQKTVEAKIASLGQKQDELDGLLARLGNAQESLLSAQAEQQQVAANLKAQMQNNEDQLAQLQSEASRIAGRMNDMQNASYASSGGSSSAPPAGGTSLTAEATAYCLEGTTATGMLAGRGIIAVDPGFIPLGSRVHVSGYGDAIAADTGGAINGNIIDVWLPCGEAISWGRRTVTVTIY